MVITIVDGIPNVLTCFILHNFLRSQGPSCTSLYNAPGSYDTENIKTHVVLPGICHDEELSIVVSFSLLELDSSSYL